MTSGTDQLAKAPSGSAPGLETKSVFINGKSLISNPFKLQQEIRDRCPR